MMDENLKYSRTDKNGTKIYFDYRCKRCAGQGGREEWTYTGFTCYECGGTGKSPKPRMIKIYTPEYQAKLDDRRAKAAEKREQLKREEAEEKNKEWLQKNFPKGKIWVVTLKNTYSLCEDLKAEGAKYNSSVGWYFKGEQDKYPTEAITAEEGTVKDHWGYLRFSNEIPTIIYNRQKARKPVSEYAGIVGEKLTISATYTHSAWFESKSPYTHCIETTYIHHFEADNGAILIWKTGKGNLGIDENQKVSITAVVKDHSEYNDQKQTVLKNCKIKEQG